MFYVGNSNIHTHTKEKLLYKCLSETKSKQIELFFINPVRNKQLCFYTVKFPPENLEKFHYKIKKNIFLASPPPKRYKDKT